MNRLTYSTLVAWYIAATEARALRNPYIEPEHLFIGLCKIHEVDASTLREVFSHLSELDIQAIQAEVCEFTKNLESSQLDARKARRLLRQILSKQQEERKEFSGHRSARCRKIFDYAETLAGSHEVGLVHLMRALLGHPSSILDKLFASLSISRKALLRAFRADIGSPPQKPRESGSQDQTIPFIDLGSTQPDPSVLKLIPPELARKHLIIPVQLSDQTLYLAMANPTNVLAIEEIMSLTGYQVLPMYAREEVILEWIRRYYGQWDEETPEDRTKGASLLVRLGRDLTQLARKNRLGPVIGRKKEMRRVAQILLQHKKPNAILIGESGVGKTCIVEGLALKVVHPEAPRQIRNLRIIEISMASLVAGTKYRGEFEERLKEIIAEASSDRNIVLFIDEIHAIVGAGSVEGMPMDAGDILKPALAQGEIRVIGATTIGEYRLYIEKDKALMRRFQTVVVEEPTAEETLEILRGVRPNLEEHHRVSISDGAIQQAVALSIRYLPEQHLPDKAVSLIDEACAMAVLKTLSPLLAGQPLTVRREDRPQIEPDDIARVVSARCGIPLEELTVDERERLLRMEEVLKKRVVGQDNALREVCATIQATYARLQDPRRPKGIFLFLGPTGTGKTELAKALAEFLFHDEKYLIRFDMSEFSEKQSVAKLIGAPPGYVGYEEEGQLTGRVRTWPYCVILLDEIENAHPEVIDLFLQIFDEGHLTDAKGRRVNFKEAVIILTSNLGGGMWKKKTPRIGIRVDKQTEEVGKQEEPSMSKWHDYEQAVIREVQKAFRPEFINRIQKAIVFHPLRREHIAQIIDKLIGQVNQRLSDKQIELELSESAKELLIQRGYSEDYGVREMERAIAELIVQPLARHLLEGRLSCNRRIYVTAEAGQMVFHPNELSGREKR